MKKLVLGFHAQRPVLPNTRKKNKKQQILTYIIYTFNEKLVSGFHSQEAVLPTTSKEIKKQISLTYIIESYNKNLVLGFHAQRPVLPSTRKKNKKNKHTFNIYIYLYSINEKSGAWFSCSMVQKVPIINCKDKYEKSIKNNIFIIMTF